MIEVIELTKRYGHSVAVDSLTFTVQPGIITGFLGPNGAGKSTTVRLMLGLDAPTSGVALVNGRRYGDLRAPPPEIGAMLEAHAVHTGRSAFNHLLALAQTHGLPRSRVGEVIEIVGLQDVARRRVGTFSLGMGQRLGIASALLGDPATVILAQQHVQVSLGHPPALRAVFGDALFLTMLAIFCVSLGALIRNTAGGIAAFAGVMFALPGHQQDPPDEPPQRPQPLPALERRGGAAHRPSLRSLAGALGGLRRLLRLRGRDAPRRGDPPEAARHVKSRREGTSARAADGGVGGEA